MGTLGSKKLLSPSFFSLSLSGFKNRPVHCVHEKKACLPTFQELGPFTVSQKAAVHTIQREVKARCDPLLHCRNSIHINYCDGGRNLVTRCACYVMPLHHLRAFSSSLAHFNQP